MPFIALRSRPAAPPAAAPQVFTQNLTASLSFVGAFSASRLFLRNFSATLFQGGLNDGDPVSTWTDSSGNANHATQTGSARPTFKTNILNGKPVLRFTSSASQCLNLTSTISSSSPWTVIVVMRQSGSGVGIYSLGNDTATTAPFGPIFNTDNVCYIGDNGGNVFQDGAVPFPGTFGIASGLSSGVFFLNGTSAGLSNIGTWSTGNFSRIGKLNTLFSDGDIADLVLYNSALSSTDRANVEKFLGDKYAITVAGGSSVDPSTITGLQGWWKADSLTDGSTASLSVKALKAFAATCSSVAALSRRVAKGLAATSSFIGATTKSVRKALAAMLSFVGNLATNLIHGGTTFTQNLAATLSFIGSFSEKNVLTRAFTATLSFTGAVSRRTGKALSATFGASGSLVRKYLDAGFSATLSFTGSVTKKLLDAGFAATLSFTGFVSASKSFLKFLTATLSFAGAMTPKQILTRAFTATLNATATLSRSTGKALSATLVTAASLAKRSTRTFTGTFQTAGALVKAIRDAGFSATLSFVGTLGTLAVHFFTRSFTATLSFVGSLGRIRLIQRVFTATLAFSGAISRRIGKVFAALLSFSTAIRRAIRKTLAATLSFIGFIFKGGAVTILAGAVTRCFALIGISGGKTSATRAQGETTVQRISGETTGKTTGGQTTAERTK